MPKFHVFSDLHIPVNHGAPAIRVPNDADFVVVAGDIAAPLLKSIEFLEAEVASQGKPVIFVAGNHEHYGQQFEQSMSGGRWAHQSYPKTTYLENSCVLIDGVRLLGCTLWTAYDLYGRVDIAMSSALLGLNDHATIRSTSDLARSGMFSPEQALALHRESRAWLEDELSKPFDGMTVVVTHHGPHPMSVAPQFAKDAVTPAFVSDLSAVIEKWEPDLWVHGHTHHSFDYVVPGTKTRVCCNPRGYGDENPRFDIGMVVEC